MRGRSGARSQIRRPRSPADIADPSAIPTVRMTPLTPVAMPTSPAATAPTTRLAMAVSAKACPRPSTPPASRRLNGLPWKAVMAAIVDALRLVPMISVALEPMRAHRPPVHGPARICPDAVRDEQRSGRRDGQAEAVAGRARRLGDRRERHVGHEDPATDAQRGGVGEREGAPAQQREVQERRRGRASKHEPAARARRHSTATRPREQRPRHRRRPSARSGRRCQPTHGCAALRRGSAEPSARPEAALPAARGQKIAAGDALRMRPSDQQRQGLPDRAHDRAHAEDGHHPVSTRPRPNRSPSRPMSGVATERRRGTPSAARTRPAGWRRARVPARAAPGGSASGRARTSSPPRAARP